jgi:hypothetical protein
MLLTRQQILDKIDLVTEDVPVPEWAPDGTEDAAQVFVRVRTLTGTERDQFETSCSEEHQGTRNFRARLCALCLVGEDGKALFSFDEAAKLGAKSAVALDRVFDVCLRLNGMSAKSVDDAEKNSVPGQNGHSGSASPTNIEHPSASSRDS